ncbi:MAG: 16S rRNA (adenine(1518)-N(6)/adenine(1519)-N(6))-dimethyltransferase RsmA [Patescibacteria group bacterium]
MLYAKKSLGQNFLHSKKAISDIVLAGEIQKGETVLEAGPGTGILTEALLQAGAKVLAIEKDRRLIPVLEQKFAVEIASGNLTLIEGDILDFDSSLYPLHTTHYKLVANIPYYITGVFIRKFLETEHQPNKIVILIQKEVAERIVTRDGKESLLSLGVKAYGTPKYIATVTKGNFRPAPNVDSAILAIENISRNNFENPEQEKKLFALAKKAFGQKRKMITGTLGVSAETLSACGIEAKARPEELSLKDWLYLTKNI